MQTVQVQCQVSRPVTLLLYLVLGRKEDGSFPHSPPSLGPALLLPGVLGLLLPTLAAQAMPPPPSLSLTPQDSLCGPWRSKAGTSTWTDRPAQRQGQTDIRKGGHPAATRACFELLNMEATVFFLGRPIWFYATG